MIHPSKFQKILLCCCVEIYKIRVYHWGVRAFSAKSTKHPLLNILLWNQNMFNWLVILWKTCWYVYVVSRICLKKNDDDLGNLSSIQKCIKWGWCIIKGWMTVPGGSGHGKRKEEVPNQHYMVFWKHYDEDNEWVEEWKAVREPMAGSTMPAGGRHVHGLFHIKKPIHFASLGRPTLQSFNSKSATQWLNTRRIFLQFLCDFLQFLNDFSTWPKWMLHLLHFGYLGGVITHYCQIDWNGTVG